MGTDRDARHVQFVAIWDHFSEGHGVTEPLGVERKVDPRPGAPQVPVRINPTHPSGTPPIRASQDVLDLPRHVHVAPAADDTQTGNRLTYLVARYERANRALNILVAASALLLLSPFLLLIALAIKLTSPGPILYTQTRVGRDHRFSRDRRLRRERRDGGDRRAGLDRRGRIERREFRNRR